LTKLASERQQRKADRKNQKDEIDPLHITSRIPGGVAALANDGDFLWLGIGNNLLLLHKPSLSLVAGCNLGVRHSIASLAISDTYVWAGTAFGDNSLLRLQKAEFMSVPRSHWVGLAVTPQERERFVKEMSLRDQALYAFYCGDDARVVQLLEGTDPGKASLEKMFLLAWCYDAAGVDDPQKAKAWCERIITNYPDSPWADFASEAISENDVSHSEKQLREQGLALFDRNRNGALDDAEKRAMAKDPTYARAQQAVLVMQTSLEMNRIVRRYDADGDGRLDEPELDNMTRMITLLLTAEREMPQAVERNSLLARLISEKATAALEILKHYDSDKDGKVNADELSALALEIAKHKKS
jgi:Ca2+-binding EF-hand superfamily protein